MKAKLAKKIEKYRKTVELQLALVDQKVIVIMRFWIIYTIVTQVSTQDTDKPMSFQLVNKMWNYIPIMEY